MLTWNVHRCIGWDGRLSPERIAQVIARCEPDLVALQELDVGHRRTGYADQPAVLADLLKLQRHFYPAVAAAGKGYGIAILSPHPLELLRAGPLPALRHPFWPEPRGALWVRADVRGRGIHFLNTHLGLSSRERLAQADALLGPGWLGGTDCTPPLVLCGDLNARPGSSVHRRLRQALPDALARPSLPCNTWPSLCPVVRLDHVFHTPDLAVKRVQTPTGRHTRVASDHLPLLVEFALP